MRKLFAKAALPMLAVVLPLSSCEQIEEVIVSQPRVSIEGAGMPTQQECKVRFTPSEDALSYVYALGTVEDAEDFSVGIMDGMVTVDGNEANEVLFSELSLNSEFCVFARAFDKDGEPSPVSSYIFRTGRDNIVMTQVYLTDCSAGVKVEYLPEYSRCDYYMGRESDKEDFLAGKLRDSSLFDRDYPYCTINSFDLEPSTDYVLYVRGFDRYGVPVDYREFALTTLEEGSCPKAEMKVNYCDVYKAELEFTANDKTGKILTMIAQDKSVGKVNDIIFTMTSGAATGVVTSDANGQKRTWYNNMKTDERFEWYVIATDKSGNPVSLYRYDYMTPPVTDNPSVGEISIEVSQIEQRSAVYTFNCTGDVFSFLYGTFDADWYDAFKESYGDEWEDIFVHRLLSRGMGYLAYKDEYKDGQFQFKEMADKPGVRYYAVAAQVNENGYEEGFMPSVFKEYTTLK